MRNKSDKESLEAFEIWWWRRMEDIRWTKRKNNERIVELVKKKKIMFRIIENRREKMIGHLIRRDKFIRKIMEYINVEVDLYITI